MKKVIAGLMMSATILGLATFATNAVSVHAADTTNPDTGTTISATAGTATSSNNANLTVQAGELSFTQPEDVPFKDAAIETVYNGGYEETVDGGSTLIKDFLGDNKDWTLTATAKGFGDSVLDDDKQSNLTLNGLSLNKDQIATVKTGNAGETTVNLSYKLKIEPKTLMNAGNYTSQVNWSLSNVANDNVQ